MKHKILCIYLALILALSFNFLLALPVAAEANEVWVAPAGDDNNPGTQTEPFASIQKGITAVSSPGKVYVAAGTYIERITLKNNVEVLGAGPDVTTINANGTGKAVTAESLSQTTKLSGFCITGGKNSFGAGMSVMYSYLSISNCIFTGNSANYGGGIYSESSSPTINNCTFNGNSATRGSGIYNWASSPKLTNCIFSNNAAASTGGGIENQLSSLSNLTNCIFTGNSANYGGGIYNSGSSFTVINCTFSGNSAYFGGGVYNETSSPATIANSILWGNTAATGPEVFSIYGLIIANSDINGGYNGTDNINEDPALSEADMHPGPDSPCIDSGDNDFVPADTLDLDNDGDTAEKLPFDLDGNPRIFGDTVDMGAYEFQQANEPMTAEAGGPYIVNEGDTIILDASDSINPNGDIDSYEWDLDNDGEYDDATGVTTSLPALDDASFSVGLKITDTQGHYATDTATVSINNVTPEVSAGATETVFEGDNVTYTGSFIDPGTVDTHTIIWDFGDDSPPVEENLTPSHVYIANGIYTAVLTVADDDGGIGSAEVVVTVNDLGPTAVVTGDTELETDSAGNYDASGSTSSPDIILSYEWDWDYDGINFFASGDTGELQTHAWSGNGTYTVALRVTDNDGSMDIGVLSVTVDNPPPETMVENLSDLVEQMELPANIENNLDSSLDIAIKVIEDSNPKNDVAAINALEAFINKVEAQRGKKIPNELADELINEALKIIAAINGGA